MSDRHEEPAAATTCPRCGGETTEAEIEDAIDRSAAKGRDELVEAARRRMRDATTARVPTVSADDIHTVLAELASTQAALRDLKAEHSAALEKLTLHEGSQLEIARAARGQYRG